MAPEDLANFNTGDNMLSESNPLPGVSHPPPPWPFANMSKFLLMNWVNTGSTQKTEAEITRLAQEVICSPDFKVDDLKSFDAHRENKKMDDAITAAESSTPFSHDGWREISVNIQVPAPSGLNVTPRVFSVGGLHLRSLVEVIKAAWSEGLAGRFHLSPFKRIHVHPESKVETRVFDEVYTGDAWIQAHDTLQKQPNEPGCQLEKVIVGLMFWSDSTHLTSFRNARVWPLYLYFANLSKYIRSQPNSGACHHVAYIPSVCDSMISPILSFLKLFQRFLTTSRNI